jgi:hypothetical protein
LNHTIFTLQTKTPSPKRATGQSYHSDNSVNIISSFSHPDFTVGSGISPDRLIITLITSVQISLTRNSSNDQFADFTAGWESHPKNLLSSYIIVRHIRLCNHYFVLISRISFLIGRTNVGDTDNSSIPILRNVSVRVISAPSSPQIPTQHPALCPFSIVF